MLREYLMFMLVGMCVILMIFSFITNSVSKRRKYVLFFMPFISAISLISDRIAYMSDGVDGITAFWSLRICKFFVYISSLLIIFIFNQYLKELFVNEKQQSKNLKSAECMVIVGILLLIISQFTGLYYSFGDNNEYIRSKGYIISYIVPLIPLLMQASVIIKSRKQISCRLFFPLLLFTLMPFIAAGCQFFVHGTSLVGVSIVAMVILLFCFSIVDTNKLVELAHKKEIEILREEQENIRKMLDQTTAALVEGIDAKDSYTNGHSLRVAEYSVMIAKKAGKSEKECKEIYRAGLMHDVGKIGIPDEIIKGEKKLTPEEIDIIKTHTLIGKEILSKIEISPNLSIGANYHHERYDGNGYPCGLKGKEIPEIARIIAVADTYDAMASKRSYRDVLPQEVCRQEIEKGVGTQFDPVFAKIMIEIIDADREYKLKQS